MLQMKPQQKQTKLIFTMECSLQGCTIFLYISLSRMVILHIVRPKIDGHSCHAVWSDSRSLKKESDVYKLHTELQR